MITLFKEPEEYEHEEFYVEYPTEGKFSLFYFILT